MTNRFLIMSIEIFRLKLDNCCCAISLLINSNQICFRRPQTVFPFVLNYELLKWLILMTHAAGVIEYESYSYCMTHLVAFNLMICHKEKCPSIIEIFIGAILSIQKRCQICHTLDNELLLWIIKMTHHLWVITGLTPLCKKNIFALRIRPSFPITLFPTNAAS